RRETRGVKSLICPTAKAECFSRREWTGQIRLKSLNKFPWPEIRSCRFQFAGDFGQTRSLKHIESSAQPWTISPTMSD
ncbi:hypothetical protein, partial [Bradyrhizobium sp. Leo121]|uniref:hypothetical protein n=1 Tax=Bradyrhizobium sp. Leo121 TaxID=1571195 RepID=UPI001A939E67